MRDDVLIVGAGPAGLAAAWELGRAGVRPRVIDRADRLAASWRARHDQLCLNTHRMFSHQPGRRIPRSAGAYPRRDDYVRYLEDWVAWSGIGIELGVDAQRVEADPGGGWRLDTDAGALAARHLVVATGSDRLPWIPPWPGREDYRGTIIHAGEFRRARDHVGQRVLLVGAGNSGVDIGNHLAAVDIGPSWVSIRNGPTIAPQYALGIPLHPLVVAMRWLPLKLQDFSIALVSRLVLGDLTRHGIPRPPRGALTRQIEDGVVLAVDSGFVAALKAGRFRAVPPIASFGAERVHLADGTTIEPDVVICATGYRLGLEPLVGHLGVLDTSGRPRFVADRASPAHPGLWFLGHNSSTYGNLHIRRAEARRLARRIAADLERTAEPAPIEPAMTTTGEEQQ